MRILLILITLLLAGSGIAQSQEPPPAPTRSEQQNQGKSIETKKKFTKHLRGTHEKPLIIDVLPAPNADEIAKRKSEQEEKKETLDRWLTGATVALAFITFFLARYTAKLWHATKTLAEDAKRTADRQAGEMLESLRIAKESADAAKNTALTMEKTAERELRAYMMVDEVEIVNSPEPGYSGAYVYIHVKNFGQTPATDIRFTTSALIRERPLASPPLTLDSSIKPMTLGILAPSDTLRSRFEIPLMEGTGNEFDITRKIHAFYVFGMFQYRDAFHHERITRFCYMRTGEYWTSNGYMDVCQEGNEAT